MKPTLGALGAILLLIATTLALRLLSFQQESLANITPVAGMAVCFGLFFTPWRWGIVLALATLFASDLMITALAVQRNPEISFWSLLFSPTVCLRYAVYGGILAVAWRLRDRAAPSRGGIALGMAPCATLGFYLVMNTVAWAQSVPPMSYAKTFAGWWQSQTVGLPIPGAPPSYVFLRNALIGDLLFTVLFLTLLVWLPRRQRKQEPASPHSAQPRLKGLDNVV